MRDEYLDFVSPLQTRVLPSVVVTLMCRYLASGRGKLQEVFRTFADLSIFSPNPPIAIRGLDSVVAVVIFVDIVSTSSFDSVVAAMIFVDMVSTSSFDSVEADMIF